MLASLGWGLFLLWGIFDACIAVFAFFFLKETVGLSLETIAHQRYKKGSSSTTAVHSKVDDHADDHISRT